MKPLYEAAITERDVVLKICFLGQARPRTTRSSYGLSQWNAVVFAEVLCGCLFACTRAAGGCDCLSPLSGPERAGVRHAIRLNHGGQLGSASSQ